MLETYAENTWCTGCGNFGILTAVKRAVKTLIKTGISKDRLVMSAGIGCHAKIFDYLNISGLYSIHGRSMATVQGMKIANPDLKVITFVGDGDAYGEGIAHLLFAAKRNSDITVIVHNNGVYGLTTGQYTPTSKKGFKGRSTPRGSVEEPLNPLTLMLEAGATFVARAYSGKIDEMAEIFVQAVEHEGFSFVDVLQPCVTYNNTYRLYNEITQVLGSIPKTYEEALNVARAEDKLYIGVIYKREKPVFHKQLYGDWNPVKNSLLREEKIRRITKLISDEKE
jgi:2-oxoglutarate ferredoxin oxidoreductase subunit beta